MRKIFTLMVMACFAITANAQLVISEIMYNPPEAGSDSLEYIEIYNAGSSTVNLRNYTFNEGVTHTFAGGEIAAGEYFVIAVDSLAIKRNFGIDAHEWTSGGLSNGGEDIELADAQGNVLDYVDYDDGGSWPTSPDGTGYSLELSDLASDNTLGSNWAAGQKNTGVTINGSIIFASPGKANGPAIPTSGVGFNLMSDVVVEGVRTNYYHITATGLSGTEQIEVPVSVSPASSATVGVDYNFTATTVTLTATDSVDSVAVSFLDDAVYEGDESLHLVFGTVTGGVANGNDTLMITIEDDEFPWVTIEELRQNDANGVSLYDGQKVWCGGIVNTSTSLAGTFRMQISMQSNGWGISSYVEPIDDYSPEVGDSVIVLGTVGKFNGLTQFTSFDSTALISSGNTVEPEVVTELGEQTESKLVKLEGMNFLDVADWRTSGSFNIDITNGMDTFTMRVDADAVEGWDAYDVGFDLIGIGGQFDRSAPHDEGYQIFPQNYWQIEFDEYPLTIEEARTNDSNEVSLYDGRTVRTSGIVNTDVSFNGRGIQISFEDNGWGLTIYGRNDYGYGDFAMGDSIEVLGRLGMFNGLTQYADVDTIIVHSQGNMINPEEVSDLNEMTESRLVTFMNVTLTDTNQWEQSGSFNASFTNGTDTFTLRVDSDTDIEMPAPAGSFDLVGIGGQFDRSAPHSEGYQIFPRSMDDIAFSVGVSEIDAADVSFFPNPARDIINLRTDLELDEVNIYNLLGSRVKSFNGQLNKLEVAGLESGIYLLEGLSADGQTFTVKFNKL